MINSLYIKGFKCFDESTINLSKLNLFTGINSGGKSSAIQALLILSQNITTNTLSPLNGHLVNIGEFIEARNFIKNSKDFIIRVEKNKHFLSYRFYQKGNYCLVEKLEDNEKIKSALDYNQRHIHYISADRIGAKDIYDKNLDQADKYGVLGEYTFDYLEKNKSTVLDKQLIVDKNSYTFETQLNYWLKYILNTEITTEDLIGTDRLRVQYSHNASRRLRPNNIGAGVSYIISILIICLSSNNDDIVILENPEIHLHPTAQSKLTDFFVFISNFGVQLIIESHSDHIFNGVRKNIYKNKIINTDVSINYFEVKNSISTPVKILINQQGQIENHQDGLFDQFDEDLNVLLCL